MTTCAESVPSRSWPSNLPKERLLRWVLVADAAVTGANAVAYLALADLLDSRLGLPAGMLRAVGALLAAYAVIVWVVAARPAPVTVQAVVAGNAVWAVESVVLAAAGWFTPSTAGTAWIVLQAATVAGFAAVQWRARPAAKP